MRTPRKQLELSATHKLVGAEGFEPSNTGSKVPRLTSLATPQKTFTLYSRPLAPLENDKFSRSPTVRSNATQDWTGSRFVLGTGQRVAQHDGFSELREGAKCPRGSRTRAKQPEDHRPAARHRRRRGASFPKRRLDRADFRVPADHRRLEIVDHLRRTARPGHRQNLDVDPGLAHTGGAI